MAQRLTWCVACWILCWAVAQQTQQCTKEGVCSSNGDGGADEDPCGFLNKIKATDIHSTETRWTIKGRTTYYKLAFNLGDSIIDEDGADNYLPIEKRYSELLDLKDALKLPQFDSLFPPKQTVCWDMNGCIPERKKKLPIWLMVVRDHVCSNMDELKATQAKLMRSNLQMTDTDSIDTDALLEKADNKATAHDLVVRKWWKASEKERRGKCKLHSIGEVDPEDGKVKVNAKDLVLSEDFLGLESFCPDFGKSFGWWGKVGCPAHLNDVVQSVKEAPCKGGVGGLGGIPPLICRDFVMKVAKEEEVDPIKGLLYILKDKNLATDSLSTLLLPVCRLVKVALKHPETGAIETNYFTISPTLALDKKGKQYTSGRYDLKGNWGYSARYTQSWTGTLKDQNFKKMFPESFDIVGYSPANGPSIAELVVQDSKILAELDHIDYSILADIVELPPPPKEADTLRDFQERHKKFPLIWGRHGNKTYVAAFGIIDLFMRFDKKSLKDRLGTGITQAFIDQCTPWDPDPIQPLHYRTRFVRMVGYNVPGPGSHAEDKYDPLLHVSGLLYHCGACVRRSLYARAMILTKGRKAVDYTCFTSDYQQDAYQKQQGKEGGCEWSE